MGAFSARRLIRTMLLLGLGLLAIFAEAAPLGHEAAARPSPDLLFLVVAYFSVRRPGTALLLLVFTLGVVRDLLTDPPVGAAALALVAASEALKSVSPSLRRSHFPAELLAISVVLAGMLLVQWLVLVLTFLEPPPLMVLIQQWGITVAIYPVLALVLRWMFRIGWRKPERV